MQSRHDSQDYGEAGCVYETGTTAITGDFCAIQLLTTTTFSLLTNTLGSGDAMTGIAFAAGQTLRGKFTAFTLTSGAVCAYKSAP